MHLASLTQLHLGLGSFHRAHQVAYMQALHDAGDTRWQVVAGNLRPGDEPLIDTLVLQRGAFSLETVTPAGQARYQRLTALREAVPFEPGLGRLRALAAEAGTRIVSFTVTEAGYYLDDAANLDLAAADVRADLAVLRGHAAPQRYTIYGALAVLLRERMQVNGAPITLLNCDNLRHNGERVRTGLQQFLQAVGDEDLLAWVNLNTRCPSAMVDRITPRPVPQVRERVHQHTGLDDPAALMAESFSQWVIEDDFMAGRPEWERVGVEMVSDVAPYEEAKIRLLNATHSCIAWAGTLAGFTYIHEGALDDDIRSMAHAYATDDVIPELQARPGSERIDLPRYRDVVLERFGNAAIADTNQRVSADGFAKIPGFIAPTIRERLARGARCDATALLPALFLAFLRHWHGGRLPFVYQDQAMDEAVAHAIVTASDPVSALAASEPLWGPLAGDARLVMALRDADARVAAFEQRRGRL